MLVRQAVSVNQSPRMCSNWATRTWCRSRTARCRSIWRSMFAPRWSNARRLRCEFRSDVVSSRDMTKYASMRPYFAVVADGVAGLVDGTDFFDIHAEDVVVEYVITVPDYPRRIVGREALAELYSNYGDSIVQSGSSEVYRYYDPEKAVVVLEYTLDGTVVSTSAPYLNRIISVITVKDRKIVHWRDYLDPLAVFAAFGNAPAPGAHMA